MTRKLVYVSGPYRDSRGTFYVNKNIEAAKDIAAALWEIGYAVICPHANTHHMDGVVGSDDFIAGDLVMVERCDAVVMIPGWDRSEGAKAELLHAGDKCRVFYWPRDIDAIVKFAKDAPRAWPQHAAQQAADCYHYLRNAGAADQSSDGRNLSLVEMTNDLLEQQKEYYERRLKAARRAIRQLGEFHRRTGEQIVEGVDRIESRKAA